MKCYLLLLPKSSSNHASSLIHEMMEIPSSFLGPLIDFLYRCCIYHVYLGLNIFFM